MTQNAKNLDNRRLGKQRIEGLQIASCLLEKETRWKNHPAVKMWGGYEGFLINYYLEEIFKEWELKGFKNDKCELWYEKLKFISNNQIVILILKPAWLTSEFIEAHRSNLIRKDYDFYKSLFPNTIEGLSYIWPVK